MSPFKLSASEGPQSNRGFHHICERKERDGLTVDRRPGNLTSEMAILPRAESFMRTRTRGSPSWPERTLRGRIHYCRLIETNSQKSTCRSGAGHTFGSDRVRKKQSSAIIAADVRRFSHLINTDEVLGTHNSRSLVVVLGSGPAVQGIVLGPGDRLFDEAKVKVKQFLGLRAGDDRGFAIGRRHGNLCGQKGPGSIGGVIGGNHRCSSCRWIPRSFPIRSV